MEIVGKKFKLEQLLKYNLVNKGDSSIRSQNSSCTKIDSVNLGIASASTKKKYKKNLQNPKENSLKHKNFFEACNLIRTNQIAPNFINMTQSLQTVSEFSVDDANLTREENVENYLHKPLVKTFEKKGNQIIHRPCHSTKLSVNIPYIMNDIFRDLMPKIVELDSEDDDLVYNNDESKTSDFNLKKEDKVIQIIDNLDVVKNNDNDNKSNSNISQNPPVASRNVEDKKNGHYHGNTSWNTSNYNNNKRSTSAFSNKRNNRSINEISKDVEPFGLINDLDKNEEIQIKDVNGIHHKKSSFSKKSEEIFIMESANELENNKNNNKINDENQNPNIINSVESLENNSKFDQYCIPEERKNSDIKVFVNNSSKLNSNSFRTTSGKKCIPPKFSFSKQKLFQLSDEKTSGKKSSKNNLNKNLANEEILNQIRKIKEEKDIGGINKNLLDNFNSCSNHSSMKNRSSLTPSAELLKFTPENANSNSNKENQENNGNNGNGMVTPKNELNLNDNCSPIRVPEEDIKAFFSTSTYKKNRLCSSEEQSVKIHFYDGQSNKEKKGNQCSNSCSKAVNLTYSISSPSSSNKNNDTAIKISSNKKHLTHKNLDFNSEEANKNSSESKSNYEEGEEEAQYGQTVYDLDFYNNLLNSEKINPNPSRIYYQTYFPDPVKDNFILQKHPNIKTKDLVILFDWIMQISEEFAFKRDTFHYCLNYINRYLYYSECLPKEKLQLIGVTCLSIAAKIEEVQIPKLQEYSNSTENIYSIQDIISSEINFLTIMKWKIVPITINTWLNWYMCQWDLFVDTIEDNKNVLLSFTAEDKILYFKKSDDNSYYNFRRITQMVDLIMMDFHSMKFKERYLVAALIFVNLIMNYNFEYDFDKKEYLGKELELFNSANNIYCNFINQSFDIEFYEEELADAISYCGRLTKFDFSYELPLIYQLEENELDNVS